MKINKVLKLKLKLLQNRTQRFSKKNILNLRSYSELIFALKNKYPILFNIIKKEGIQYRQFLSIFFTCILNSYNEPFSIKIKNESEKIYNLNSANYNYDTLLPWSNKNIIKCYNKNKKLSTKINISKKQFEKCIVVLYPKFIKIFPHFFIKLIERIQKIKKAKIGINKLYKILIYCGDKLAKYEYYNKKNYSNKFKFSENKIKIFLKIFNFEQLINVIT